MTKQTRVLFFVTAPQSSNGYSYVGYELAKYFSPKPDIHLTIFAFQNFNNETAGNLIPNHRKDYPNNVHVFDAFANENPKQAGFGITLVKDFVTTNRPDVVIVYNDMLVLTSVIAQLREVPNRKFKIIAYIDQVYLCQKKEYITFVNNNADIAMLFTPYWEDCMKSQGISIPTCYLHHGFNKMIHYPIPKHLARKFYGLKDEDFIVLNLNRNQPRKRWDICLQAFAEVVKRMPNEPIKLLIATAVQGAWNLLEVYERELKKRGLNLADGMKHVILLDNPQQLSDEDVNFLYNVADIGLNTCDGEGFGLCNFQQAAIGIPQVVPNIGGFRDFFDETNALLVEPTMTYYVDNSRDMVCGEAELCNFNDFAEAIIKYYKNRDLMKQHGEACRKHITSEYPWEKFGDKLYGIINDISKTLTTITETEEVVEETNDEEININSLKEMIAHVDEKEETDKVENVEKKTKTTKTKSTKEKKTSTATASSKVAKEKLKEKLKGKSTTSSEKETIDTLQKKLEKLRKKDVPVSTS
jgi:glycosyltransferase involved in cell wall biosynthesis